MHIGIDLGTSNSAVVGFVEGKPRVFKTAEGHDVLPSVIHIDRRGNKIVGVRAYEQSILAPENTAAGFKRLMGTSTEMPFAAYGRSMLPEDCSADILRALLTQVFVETGVSAVTGAVITVPAAFNQMQTEATLLAAEKAGIEKVALLQEPIAAAMAAMSEAKGRNAQFLVYDLGGGTFDLALVQALKGEVNVVAHEGVNMLGGRDFDMRILDNVVRPWLAETFELPAGFQSEPRYQRLMRQARLAAERAKIALSGQTEIMINVSEEVLRAEDAASVPIYLDVPLTRETVDRLVHDRVSETIQLCRKIIKDAGYSHEDIERIVLVGGPTKMPGIRERIGHELGIRADVSVDPMTAVAIGAAIFCESRDWSAATTQSKAKTQRVETEGSIGVVVDFPARTADSRARIRVRSERKSAGYSIQIDSTLGWTSGRLTLDDEQVIAVDLPDPGPNRFRILVFDTNGRPIAGATREIAIERSYAAAAGIPVLQTISAKVRDSDGSLRNSLEKLIGKGELLPRSGEAKFRAARALRNGDDAYISLELFQVADEALADPALHLHIGDFRIKGTDLPEGAAIRKNDEIAAHWNMNESGLIQCDLHIPAVSQIFKTKYFAPQAGHQAFHGEDGLQLVTSMLDDAEHELAEAETAIGGGSQGDIAHARDRLDAQRQQLKNGADPEQRRGISEEARKIRQDLARACSEIGARQAILARSIDDVKRRFDTFVRAEAERAAAERFDGLVRNAHSELSRADDGGLKNAERIKQELWSIYWAQGLRAPSFLVGLFRDLQRQRYLAMDKPLFDRHIAAGERALAKNDMNALRETIFDIWDNRVMSGGGANVTAPATLFRA
jgi:molecular chaperone DnaK